MQPDMPVFADWLRENALADHGLALMLFVALIALSWLAIARFISPNLLIPMARVLQVIWFVTGAMVLIAFLVVR